MFRLIIRSVTNISIGWYRSLHSGNVYGLTNLLVARTSFMTGMFILCVIATKRLATRIRRMVRIRVCRSIGRCVRSCTRLIIFIRIAA